MTEPEEITMSWGAAAITAAQFEINALRRIIRDLLDHPDHVGMYDDPARGNPCNSIMGWGMNEPCDCGRDAAVERAKEALLRE